MALLSDSERKAEGEKGSMREEGADEECRNFLVC